MMHVLRLRLFMTHLSRGRQSKVSERKMSPFHFLALYFSTTQMHWEQSLQGLEWPAGWVRNLHTTSFSKLLSNVPLQGICAFSATELLSGMFSRESGVWLLRIGLVTVPRLIFSKRPLWNFVPGLSLRMLWNNFTVPSSPCVSITSGLCQCHGVVS